MSFFDQPYYALTKTYMSRIGLWPEQSKHMRIIRPLTMFTISITLVVPALIRMHNARRDINILARNITMLLIETGIFIIALSCIKNFDKMKLALKIIEEHWKMLKNTPAMVVLDKYAERGRYITLVYSSTYIGMLLYFILCLSPVILDVIDPVNETRPKIYVVEVEYGIDAEKHYWLVLAHAYIVAGIAISMMIAIGTIYILWVVHACALFEVVGFADMIESGSFGCSGVVLALIAIITVISGVQALMNWKHPEILMQQATLIIGQVFHLYIISIPGQELINHSEKIHTVIYNSKWQDMSVNAQKLLIIMLMRCNKPSYLTAGKAYVLSMETFGSALRTMISYFTVFAQMI